MRDQGETAIVQPDEPGPILAGILAERDRQAAIEERIASALERIATALEVRNTASMPAPVLYDAKKCEICGTVHPVATGHLCASGGHWRA